MTLNIISNPKITQRVQLITEELQRQGITDYKFWPSIHIANKPKRTGISRAHKQIIEWALVEQIPEVCVVEDDVWFPANDGFKYFLDKKPEQYDLYLGGISRGEIDDQNITKRFCGFFCYCVHERFYTRYLGVSEDVDIDGGMADRGLFKVCYPFAAICHPCYSDNQQGVVDYSHLFKGREVYGIGTM